MDSAPKKKDKKPTNLAFLTDYVNQILLPLLHLLPLYLCLTARLPKRTPSIESRTTVCYVQLPTNASRRTYLLGRTVSVSILKYVCVLSLLTYTYVPIDGTYAFRQYSYRRIGGHDQKIRALCALSDTLVRRKCKPIAASSFFRDSTPHDSPQPLPMYYGIGSTHWARPDRTPTT